jgi:hypothetical protein
MTTHTTPAEGEAAFSELPTLRGERIWGFWPFTSVNVGLAIATWSFLTGGTVALFAGAKTAIAAGVIGNLIGVVLVALASGIPSAKYGVEQYTGLRSVFGANSSAASTGPREPVRGTAAEAQDREAARGCGTRPGTVCTCCCTWRWGWRSSTSCETDQITHLVSR